MIAGLPTPCPYARLAGNLVPQPAPTEEALIRERIPLPAIISFYWGGFWLLNGLDAAFNSPEFFGYDHLSDMIDHFALFQLLASLARISLYLLAALEVILGLSFLLALFHSRYEASQQRCNFKTAAFIFIGLSFGDILIGDQTQLWEHGTYLLLVLASYHLYCHPPQFQSMKRERNP